jgi:hypothetical protein
MKAGLDGVRRELDPGEPQVGNTYELLQQGVEIERVPGSSRRGARRAREGRGRQSAMPGRLYKVFNHYKRDEWERYLAVVTDWELDQYLEVCPAGRLSRKDPRTDRMCGIAGIIYRDGAHAVGHDMTQMLQSMKHRGPGLHGLRAVRSDV